MENHFEVVNKGDRVGPPVFEGAAHNVADWLSLQADVKDYEIFSSSKLYYTSVASFLKRNFYLQNYVSKFYVMDPETEDVLPNGMHLRVGMKVLFESSNLKEVVDEIESMAAWRKDRLLANNRWFTVEHVEHDPTHQVTSITGIYEDDTKRQIKVGTSHAWIVKKDSLARIAEQDKQRYKDVTETIGEILDKHDDYCCKICNGNKDAPSNETLAAEATEKILGIFG